jgi:hypothetical protein
MEGRPTLAQQTYEHVAQGTSCYCIVGALSQVIASNPAALAESWRIPEPLIDTIEAAIGLVLEANPDIPRDQVEDTSGAGVLFDWNDQPERQIGEVVQVLRNVR